MALRIKSHWHDSGMNDPENKSLEETAGALAFICWRLALDKAKGLHGEDYFYKSDGQRIAVICEYLAYCLQVTDRVLYTMLSEAERRAFITEFANKLATHVQDNATDLFGERDYRTGFINTLNERSAAYSEQEFDADGPGYGFKRQLGYNIQQIMGEEKLNRWIIDQVMDIDAPDVAAQLHSVIVDLME